MSFSQRGIEEKLRLFLKSLNSGESMSELEQICSAFAFFNFRNTFFGLQDKYFERMNKIMSYNVEGLAKVYSEYKKERLHLINNKQLGINNQIFQLDKQLTQLRKNKKEIRDKKSEKALQLNNQINRVEEDRRKLREIREKKIEEILNEQFTKEYGNERWKKQIQEAKDLYLYTHTLKAAFHPLSHFSFHQDGKPVQQWDFIEILKLLPVDIPSSEEKKHGGLSVSKDMKDTQLPIRQAFQVAFNFTEQELISFFNNEFHKNTIYEGDLIRIGSGSHALFACYINGKFELYDLEPIKLENNTPEAFVFALEDSFFAKFDINNTDVMPIGITIFEKTGGKKEIGRPNRVELLKSMIAKRSDKNLNKTEWGGATAAFMAARYGHVDTLEFLNEKKADLNLPAKNGVRPSTIAALLSQIKVLESLMEYKVITLDKADTLELASIASREGQKEVLQFLALEACNRKNINALEILVRYNADLNLPDEKGNTLVGRAVIEPNHEKLEILVRLKANINLPDANGLVPATIAFRKNDTKMLRRLAELKADLNLPNADDRDRVLAAIAAEEGNTKMITLLAELKADLSFCDKNGRTPAWYAAQNNKPEVIRALKSKGANLDLSTDKDGWTPALIAAGYGHVEVISALAECKADLDLNNKKSFSSFSRIRSFIEFKANISPAKKSGSGMTPTLIAANEGRVQVLKLLADLKADLSLPNEFGATPLDLATRKGHSEVVEFIKNHTEKEKSNTPGKNKY